MPEAFYNLYPTEGLPEPKLHPRTGYEQHPSGQESIATSLASERQFGQCRRTPAGLRRVLRALHLARPQRRP
ncbi:hypothetical protein ACTMU2_40740 [Cupriavidus basilensis]